jgi:hypothetical protein
MTEFHPPQGSTREVMAWLLNVVLPGTGLIIRRREWLGFCLAMLFGICGNVALAGWLIAPAAVPSWLSWLAFGAAGVAWLLSQLLLLRQGICLKRRDSTLAELLREARSALEAGDIDRGRLALESGTAMDDENVEVCVLMARLCALQDDRGGVRTAWRRVLKLDRRGPYLAEARRALKGE